MNLDANSQQNNLNSATFEKHYISYPHGIYSTYARSVQHLKKKKCNLQYQQAKEKKILS